MPETKTNNPGLSATEIADIAASAAAQVAAKMQEQGTMNANIAALKINEKVRNNENAQKKYANRIRQEMTQKINCSYITIPEIYKKYQPRFTACVNGCMVTIPADGKPYFVHNDFALILIKRMRRLSRNISVMEEHDISEYRPE